jgi:hypothetical protein
MRCTTTSSYLRKSRMGRLGGVPNEIPGGSGATGLIGAGYDRDLSCGDSAAAACRTSPLAWAALPGCLPQVGATIKPQAPLGLTRIRHDLGVRCRSERGSAHDKGQLRVGAHRRRRGDIEILWARLAGGAIPRRVGIRIRRMSLPRIVES